MTFTKENIALERDAKNHVYELLKKYGCKIVDMGVPEEFSLTEFPLNLKTVIAQWVATKAEDAHVLRTDTHEFYLLELKGKEKDAFKNIVNQNEYDVLWNYKKSGAPLLFLIWIKENGRVYRHEIGDPKDYETAYVREKDVYFLPDATIHEFRPDAFKRLDLCYRFKRRG